MGLPVQHTIRYKTFLKMALAQALESVFQNHEDSTLRDTKVRLQYSFQEADYPTVLVDYIERDVQNAGVAHTEIGTDSGSGLTYKMRRRLYHGDINFTIYALSSVDRDVISDSLVQTLGMPELLAWTNLFALRIYDPIRWASQVGRDPASLGEAHLYHFASLNTDILTSSGDGTAPAPWGPEDVLLFTTGYRAPVFGEVLSLPPDVFYSVVEKVTHYPYTPEEPVPTGVFDPALWDLGE